ncbi:outer membrane beta-barrel protein [Flavitalea sp.]|nr:outer membrane beta-barrel protein [Flavitalea sp.]
MKAKYLITFITLVFAGSSGFAQKESKSSFEIDQLIGLNWEINVPAGNNYISKTSLSGFKFEYRKFFSDQFSAGIAIGWNTVEQYFPTKTYEKTDGSVAVTTDMIRQAFNLPMMATAHYYPQLPSHIFKPYIGIGLGAQYSSQDVYYNIYVIENDDWGFVARPEIGTLARINEKIAGIASVGYNYSTNKMDALGVSSLKQVVFNVGIAFLLD